jgi:hypothetical protein
MQSSCAASMLMRFAVSIAAGAREGGRRFDALFVLASGA